jgi:rhomboid protease GluP
MGREAFDDDVPVIDAGMIHREPVDFERGIRLVPVVTIALGLACLFAFVAQVSGGALLNLERLIDAGALEAGRVRDGEVWRLLSAVFLHGGVGHLIGNLIMLYILGMACEHAFGRARFLTLFVFAGLTGSLCSLAGGVPSVGASGAIFGLAGALMVFFVRHRNDFHLRDKRIGGVLAAWGAYQVFLGFMTPGIDNLAHLGGLAGGALLGLVLRPAIGPKAEVRPADPLAAAGCVASLVALAVTGVFFLPRLIR